MVDVLNAINQTEEAKKYWDQTTPNITPQVNAQCLGVVSVTAITRLFHEVIALMSVLNRSEIGGVAWSQHRARFKSLRGRV